MIIALDDTLQQLKQSPALPAIGKKKPKQDEFIICCRLKRQLEQLAAYGQLNCFYMHIPNGMYTNSKSAASKMKSMGVLPGAADYLFVQAGKAYFIEMKTATGAMSDNQKTFHKLCEGQHTPYAICRSEKEAIDRLILWGLVKQ